MMLTVRPWADEAISSWLSRMARVHGMDKQPFTAIAIPGTEIWTRDADRWLPRKSITDISSASGLTFDQIKAMTISAAYRPVLGEVGATNNIAWLTRVGVYHRDRRRFGQQYCPVCVAECSCYYLKWRLAFITTCHKHNVPLLDACPKCEQTVSLFGNPPKN